LSRRKGFNLQAESRRINGLPAVVVARPARWSNPWPIGMREGKRVLSRDEVIDRYERHVAERHDEIRDELKGKNLACWCAEGQRCHADTLLRIANAEPRSAGRQGRKANRPRGRRRRH
jgi:hypothetical protein